MVKVQIPLNTPKDDGDAGSDEDGVGVMSDIEESDIDDDIGDPDWEEVKDGDGDDYSFKPSNFSNDNLKNGITITIDAEPRRTRRRAKKRGKKGKTSSGEEIESESDEGEVVDKKKKKLDFNEIVRRKLNRVKITDQLMKHKLSLLIYLARGLRLVKIINCNIIKGLSLSILDKSFAIKPKRGKKQENDRKLLEMFVDRFNQVVKICSDEDKKAKHMSQPFMLNLLDCFSSLEATSLLELVVMFVACLKAMNPDLPLRIVNVLRPITLRADIIPKPGTNGEAEKSMKKDPNAPSVIEKLDWWIEVYLHDEKKWCCLDLCNAKLDEPNVLTELSRPFCYLVSYDVDRYCVKPAEKNYCDNWYTPAFRKYRCEDKWWDSLMAALGPTKQVDKDQADEVKTEQVLIDQEMPKSDNGFRNHPLYVLEKHLLKFQGIYPPEVPPMGHFKDQPIYPRDCVQTLRSRETWLRQAKTVRVGETAYKIVKARPKRDKFTGELIRDLPLELFGEWQTQDYDPPEAKDGKVPRNAYGNVDMYQECMLPKGCSWLKLPGLQRIANKLHIDCAAAVVGFDNHCGSYGAHPVIDGFIVCKEHEEILSLAWREEQANQVKKELEKREKRIWDNWKRLLKAVMIREKLRVKYKHS